MNSSDQTLAPTHETLTVTNTPTPATSAIFEPPGKTPANFAVVTVESASIRYWVDGNAPTATTGHLVAAGGYFYLESAQEIRRFLAIRTGSTDAKLQMSYSYKRSYAVEENR